MLDKAFFEPIRGQHGYIIIILELGQQIAISVIVQQPAKAADKQVAFLRHDLGKSISLFLELPDLHFWQLDPVLE